MRGKYKKVGGGWGRQGRTVGGHVRLRLREIVRTRDQNPESISQFALDFGWAPTPQSSESSPHSFNVLLTGPLLSASFPGNSTRVATPFARPLWERFLTRWVTAHVLLVQVESKIYLCLSLWTLKSVCLSLSFLPLFF